MFIIAVCNIETFLCKFILPKSLFREGGIEFTNNSRVYIQVYTSLTSLMSIDSPCASLTIICRSKLDTAENRNIVHIDSVRVNSFITSEALE